MIYPYKHLIHPLVKCQKEHCTGYLCYVEISPSQRETRCYRCDHFYSSTSWGKVSFRDFVKWFRIKGNPKKFFQWLTFKNGED